MRTGLAHQDARDDFDRARRQASWAKLAGWLHGRSSSRNRLPVLGEVTAITSHPSRWRMTRQPVRRRAAGTPRPAGARFYRRQRTMTRCGSDSCDLLDRAGTIQSARPRTAASL